MYLYHPYIHIILIYKSHTHTHLYVCQKIRCSVLSWTVFIYIFEIAICLWLREGTARVFPSPSLIGINSFLILIDVFSSSGLLITEHATHKGHSSLLQCQVRLITTAVPIFLQAACRSSQTFSTYKAFLEGPYFPFWISTLSNWSYVLLPYSFMGCCVF